MSTADRTVADVRALTSMMKWQPYGQRCVCDANMQDMIPVRDPLTTTGSTLFLPHIPPNSVNIPIVKPLADTNLLSDMQRLESLPMVTPTVIASKQQGCTERSDLTSMSPLPDYLYPLRLQPAGWSLYGVTRTADTNHVTDGLA